MKLPAILFLCVGLGMAGMFRLGSALSTLSETSNQAVVNSQESELASCQRRLDIQDHTIELLRKTIASQDRTYKLATDNDSRLEKIIEGQKGDLKRWSDLFDSQKRLIEFYQRKEGTRIEVEL